MEGGGGEGWREGEVRDGGRGGEGWREGEVRDGGRGR